MNAAALAGLRGLLQEWFPAGVFEGDEYKVGDWSGSNGRSLSINIKKGFGKDFAGDDGAPDPVGIFAKRFGLDRVEAAHQLADRLGLGDAANLPKYEANRRKAAAQLPAPREEAPPPVDPEKLAKVEEILGQCVGLKGTPGQAYLLSRGITGAPGFKWQPRAGGKSGGYLVAVGTDDAGAPMCVQRIAVTGDGEKDCTADVVKRSHGHVKGNPVRIPPAHGLEAAPLLLTEGPEDALTLRIATGLEVWACLSVSNIGHAPVPPGRHVIVCRDNDEPGSGADKRMADTLRAMSARGVELSVARPPEGTKDANDLLRQSGAGAVAAMVQTARAIRDDANATGLPVIWFDEIEAVLCAMVLVEGLLGQNQMSVWYGDSNSGKTWIVLSLALYIALGWEWFSRRVEKGGVIYVAAEGGFGIRNRVAAFRQYHGLGPGDQVPFAIVPTSVNLRDADADTDALIAAVNDAAERIAAPVRLVVIDTLSRAMAGGNENASEDMGAVVTNADKVREATGAHVAFIHHSGKDAAKGARGHSLLRAATDTEIEVVRDHDLGISTAKVTKQRDLPLEGEFSYRLEPVELGEDQYGKPVTSCVVMPDEGGGCAQASTRKLKLAPAHQLALEMLQRAVAGGAEQLPGSNQIPRGARGVRETLWREFCYQAGISSGESESAKRNAFGRAAQALQAKGLVGRWAGWAWLTDTRATTASNVAPVAGVRGDTYSTPPFSGGVDVAAEPLQTDDPFSLTD